MPRHDAQTLPLLIATDDRPGECLLSLLIRAANSNVMGRLAPLLSLAGIENVRLEYLPFTQMESVASIAKLIGVNPSAIARRMHKAIPGDREEVDWYGINLPHRWISKQVRFAPEGLKKSGDHQAVWSLKPLKHAAATGEMLHDACPSCGLRVTWESLRDVRTCSRCMADLSDTQPVYLEPGLRTRAMELARLVGTEAADREKLLSTLPTPFKNWSAGDVFRAVVEFGLIASSPVAPKGCSRMKRVTAGDFSRYSTDELVAGWDFINAWPTSFDTLVTQIAQGRPIATWKHLGRLAKFAPSSVPGTAVCKLVKERIAYLRSLSRPNAEARLDRALLTASEASEAFGVDKPILRRLGLDGNCVVEHKGGSKLFKRSRLEEAIRVWRTSSTAGEVASTLGVPEPFVPFVAAAGLIAPVDDVDSVALANGLARYKVCSIELLAQRLGEASNACPSDLTEPVSLLESMTGILSPDRWIQVIACVCDQTVLAHRPALSANALDLQVCAADLHPILSGIVREEIPNLDVSYLAAERLTGLDDIVVGGAVKSGLIQGRTAGGKTKVPLSELARFGEVFALAKDGARKLGIAPAYFAEAMRSRGYKPAGKAHHCVVWFKADVERAVAESRA